MGALPIYTELLTIGSQSEQRLACQGFWRLAFKCSELIKQEPGCVDGQYLKILRRTIIQLKHVGGEILERQRFVFCSVNYQKKVGILIIISIAIEYIIYIN